MKNYVSTARFHRNDRDSFLSFEKQLRQVLGFLCVRQCAHTRRPSNMSIVIPIIYQNTSIAFEGAELNHIVHFYIRAL